MNGQTFHTVTFIIDLIFHKMIILTNLALCPEGVYTATNIISPAIVT